MKTIMAEFVWLSATLTAMLCLTDAGIATVCADEQAEASPNTKSHGSEQEVSYPAGLHEDLVSKEAIAALVARMTSGDFAERQAATAAIQQLPAEALPNLRLAAKNATGDVGQRILIIARQLQDRAFQQRLLVFQQSPSIEAAGRLGGWDRFVSLSDTGNDQVPLFAAMLNASPELFSAAMFDPDSLPTVLEQSSNLLARQFNGRTESEFPAAAYAAHLLFGSDPGVRLVRATSTNISSAFADERLSALVTDGVQRQVLQSLISAWIQRPGIAAERPLLFAIQHRLPAGKQLASRIIEARSNRPDMILAILAFAALGDVEDVPKLQELMTNQTVLWPLRNQPAQRRDAEGGLRDTNYSVQTRDLALAVAIYLRGDDFNGFGLDVKPSELTVFAVDSLGFDSEDAREAAFSAYVTQYPGSVSGDLKKREP